MNNQQACELIERLIAGVHPTTGELLPGDSVCADPMVLRALHRATVALRAMDSPQEGSQSRPAQPTRRARGSQTRTKEPWTSEEDDLLRRAYQEGLTPAALSVQLGRSEYSVKMRLFSLGAATREALNLSDATGPSNRGTPWYPEQEAQLKELFTGGATVEDIARQLHRSKLSIVYRLEKLGLIADHAQYESRPRPQSAPRDARFPNDAFYPNDAPPPEDAPPEDDLPF